MEQGPNVVRVKSEPRMSGSEKALDIVVIDTHPLQRSSGSRREHDVGQIASDYFGRLVLFETAAERLIAVQVHNSILREHFNQMALSHQDRNFRFFQHQL